MDSVRVARKGWLIAGLSAILPGLGHWYIGKWDRAMFLVSSFLFHLTLAYTLLHMVVIEQPVSVAYLLLVIPYHYFYAIFNSLQTRNDRFHFITPILLWLSSVLLLAASALWLPFDAIYPIKQIVILHYPKALLVFASVYFIWHLRKRYNGRFYLLRISSALMLLLFSLLLLLQQSAPIQWEKWLLALLIVLPLEILLVILYRFSRKIKSGYTIDLWGPLTACCLIASGYLVIQYSDYPAELLASFHAPAIAEAQLDQESGFHYEMAPIKVSSAPSNKRIQLRHLNGYVRISSGEVDEMTIYPELYVNADNEQQALEVKEQSGVDVAFEDKLSISTTLPSYRLNQYPRMNLRIVIPKQQRFLEDMDIRVDHGAISVHDMVLSGQLKLDSHAAAIHVESVIGKTTANSKSGAIYMNKVVGDMDVQTKKGDITIIQPTRSISAITLSGDINVRAKHQYGDWNLHATVGNIQLKLPKTENYHLNARVSFGHISAPFLPLQQEQHNGDVQRKHRQQSKEKDGVKQFEHRTGTERYSIELYASNYILLQ